MTLTTTARVMGIVFLSVTAGCGGSGSSSPATSQQGADSGPRGPGDASSTGPGSDASSTKPDVATIPSDAPSTGTLSVWTAGIGRKIQPSTAAGTGTSVTMATARDAYASGQIVVRAANGDLRGVRVATADLSDGAGNTLTKDNLALFRADFIDFTNVSAYGGNEPVPKNSPTSDGLIPDALVPLVDPYSGGDAGQPFDVSNATNQPLWLDVHVPKGTPAGTYTGSVTLTASGGLSTSVPVSVEVWAIDLPDMRSLTTHFKMSVNDIIQYHAGTSACSGTDCWIDDNPTARAVVKRYEELAHTHRVDTAQQYVVMPGDGCNVPTDWTAYDAAMKPYMDGTYWSDGVPSGRVETPFSPGVTWGLETCTQSQYVAIAKAWATHLKSTGWFNQAVVYAADEPDSSQFPAIAMNSSWLQSADSSWKAHVMDTTAPMTTNVATLDPALGIYCVALAWYDNWNDHGPIYGRKDWPSLMAQGIQLWFYESNAQDAPYVTFATNTLDNLEPMMMMWGSWYEGATGFLYWDIAAWDGNDPWGPTIGFGKTGDGVLLYPGNHNGLKSPSGSPSGVAIDGPIPSQRLKIVRAGLQDWALFNLAAKKGLTAQTQQQIATVYSQLGGCTYDGCPAPAGGFFWKADEPTMAQIRKTVAQAIIAAQ